MLVEQNGDVVLTDFGIGVNLTSLKQWDYTL
jgi:hypothetical protein